MFNSTSNDMSVSIQAVAGTIVKSTPKSFIVRAHTKSQLADSLLDDNPGVIINHKFRKVVILQVMLAGDYLLIEYVMEEHFNPGE